MTLDEYIIRWARFKDLLIQRLPQFTATMALEAAALIKLRIVEKGLIGENEISQIYTSDQYKRKRQKSGRQIEHVDLTYTRGGAGMFGSTGLVLQEMKNDVARAVVAGRDEFTQNKLDWNSERYGDVLGASNKEKQHVYDAFDKWLYEIAVEAGIA